LAFASTAFTVRGRMEKFLSKRNPVASAAFFCIGCAFAQIAPAGPSLVVGYEAPVGLRNFSYNADGSLVVEANGFLLCDGFGEAGGQVLQPQRDSWNLPSAGNVAGFNYGGSAPTLKVIADVGMTCRQRGAAGEIVAPRATDLFIDGYDGGTTQFTNLVNWRAPVLFDWTGWWGSIRQGQMPGQLNLPPVDPCDIGAAPQGQTLDERDLCAAATGAAMVEGQSARSPVMWTKIVSTESNTWLMYAFRVDACSAGDCANPATVPTLAADGGHSLNDLPVQVHVRDAYSRRNQAGTAGYLGDTLFYCVKAALPGTLDATTCGGSEQQVNGPMNLAFAINLFQPNHASFYVIARRSLGTGLAAPVNLPVVIAGVFVDPAYSASGYPGGCGDGEPCADEFTGDDIVFGFHPNTLQGGFDWMNP
jgi:hypothetical protein